jgi:hypothetical protein
VLYTGPLGKNEDIKIIIFCDAAARCLVEIDDVSEALTASIIRAMKRLLLRIVILRNTRTMMI